MSTPFPIDKIRADFPILSESYSGKALAYLDSAASSQKPQCVIDSISRFYEKTNSNVHRGIYQLAETAENEYRLARKVIADWFSVTPDELIFTRGTTEALNLVAHSFGGHYLGEGDQVILSEMEHHANIVPWQLIGERIGAKIVVVPILPDGSIDRKVLSPLLNDPKSKILSICHVSNTLGTQNPLSDIIREAKENNVKVVVDGAQSVPHQQINLGSLDCDFFAFSGHKTYGPMGIGILYGKKELLQEMPPFQGGGDMIDQVSFDGTTYAPPPQRFEAGTPNVADAIGLAEAFRYLSEVDLISASRHETQLLELAREGLQAIDGFVEHGTTPDKAALLSFSIDGIHPHDLATLLDGEGIAIRTGHHCCQPLMKKLGVKATARASFAMYNTLGEAERLVAAVKKAVSVLR
jgi:cysteine desulfurase / selenocysteine lyase